MGNSEISVHVDTFLEHHHGMGFGQFLEMTQPGSESLSRPQADRARPPRAYLELINAINVAAMSASTTKGKGKDPEFDSRESRERVSLWYHITAYFKSRSGPPPLPMCPICLRQIEVHGIPQSMCDSDDPAVPGVVLPCAHIFCSECMNTHLGMKLNPETPRGPQNMSLEEIEDELRRTPPWTIRGLISSGVMDFHGGEAVAIAYRVLRDVDPNQEAEASSSSTAPAPNGTNTTDNSPAQQSGQQSPNPQPAPGPGPGPASMAAHHQLRHGPAVARDQWHRRARGSCPFCRHNLGFAECEHSIRGAPISLARAQDELPACMRVPETPVAVPPVCDACAFARALELAWYYARTDYGAGPVNSSVKRLLVIAVVGTWRRFEGKRSWWGQWMWLPDVS
ncbi:hypothetical protein B0T25DRAFT_579957 [Lasiosphaeria hispida]|uniref:RING-type domain-containing protein n=1 Tax=Lasiosphaeria hispida TaxID=260671 RepID=A0AAJ0HN82_9PEZI|nr:hypothetical protein B0T25DRAFT_579957 [Lasiosphaeria hispida]